MVSLNFLSGIKVVGRLTEIIRRNQKNLIFSFDDCNVSNAQNELLFDPSWGSYDMAIGSRVSSVAGGSADQHTFPIYEEPSKQIALEQNYDERTLQQFELYSALRECREATSKIDEIAHRIEDQDNPDWLLVFELLELALKQNVNTSLQQTLRQRLSSYTDQKLISQGLARLDDNG